MVVVLNSVVMLKMVVAVVVDGGQSVITLMCEGGMLQIRKGLSRRSMVRRLGKVWPLFRHEENY